MKLFFAIIISILSHMVWSELICNPFQGMCEGIFLKLDLDVESKQECAQVCRQTPNCTWFSFDEQNKLCFAMETCVHPDSDYTGFYSAPIQLGSDCKCGVLAHCDHGFLVEFFNVTSPVDCLHKCHIDSEENCNWVTYNVKTKSCFLFNECSYGFNVSYPYSISAHKNCEMDTLPDEEHMKTMREFMGIATPESSNRQKRQVEEEIIAELNSTDIEIEEKVVQNYSQDPLIENLSITTELLPPKEEDMEDSGVDTKTSTEEADKVDEEAAAAAANGENSAKEEEENLIMKIIFRK